MSDFIFHSYAVRICRDRATGKRKGEYWKRDGMRHRDDGPAEREWDLETGVVIDEAYYVLDKPHRDGGPCAIMRDRVSGKVIGETWQYFGIMHRDEDKPAFWESESETGIVTLEEYWVDGELHRVAGPAVIRRDAESGEVVKELYYHQGQLISNDASPDSPQP